MNELGKFLEQVRKEKKISLRDAAQKSGISYSYIRDIELGVNRKTKKEVKPSPAALKKIAEAYSINYYDLLEKAGILDEETNNTLEETNSKLDVLIKESAAEYNLGHIPLIGTICAGDGIIAESNIDGYVGFPFLNNSKPDYALCVKGDSMNRVGIEDGDIVYLRAANWVERSGQIAAVIVNGEEGTLKRVHWEPGSNLVRLVPENPKYKTIEVYPNEIRVCGVYAGHFKPEYQMDI
ncbi:helix-turn-helix domain-containing protein [Paenibacillus algicola]|uniref:helix-turn-helix domain-containing protein n=1 Tax=Paenibacillus algicola TaxID=2565926 RepID=UPI0010FD08DC|nr:S24 family peptidase [Paenibacillus algicola]